MRGMSAPTKHTLAHREGWVRHGLQWPYSGARGVGIWRCRRLGRRSVSRRGANGSTGEELPRSRFRADSEVHQGAKEDAAGEVFALQQRVPRQRLRRWRVGWQECALLAPNLLHEQPGIRVVVEGR